jgi:anaerobic glycerol-3-phosphate dehydrogenase
MFILKNLVSPFFNTLLLLIFSIFISAATVSAQPRDHLTLNEIELVRDVQELDKRMELYVKAIDRRLLVIKNDNSQAGQIEKDAEKWGELPKGTRLELLLDIKKILQEAIDKIDDIAARDAKSELLPYAVHTLADGVRRFAPELEKFRDAATERREIGVIADSLDFSNQIIEASTNP